jgi:acyl-CoA synthetase (NDP forming)
MVVNQDIAPFFAPRSVALIGVSRDMDKFNGIVLKNLLAVNYTGTIFLVNPHAKEILGIKCYPRVLDLPEVPELAIILHPDVAKILENCGKRGIKNVLIQADITLQDDADPDFIEGAINDVASRFGIRFMGPSLIGLINFPGHFTSSLIPVRDHVARLGEDGEKAGIGFMAQSGGLAGACGWWHPSQDISFAKVVHFLGQVNGSISDGALLKYMASDPHVKVISLFIRKISPSLVEAVHECARIKPILFKKCGQQLDADKLVAANALQVADYMDLFEIAKAFIFSPLPAGNRIGVIGPSSGAIDVVLSEFKKNGLELARPSPAIERKIIDLLGGHVGKRCNPVDFWPPPRFFGHEIGRIHHEAAEYLLSDTNVDAIFLVLEFFQEIEFDLRIFKDLLDQYPTKPIMGVLIQAEEDGAHRVMKAATSLKIPIFTEPECLARAYSVLYKFSSTMREPGKKRQGTS